jgi:hypothetical protein
MVFTRLHISLSLAIAVGVWGLVLWLQGTPLTWDHLAPFGTVVGALVAVAVAFEHLLWRIPWLHGWLVKRPNLRGTWRVELRSDWVDPATGRGIAPITAFMGVEQSFSTLHMHLMTPESESWLIADAIRLSPTGTGYQIVGVYTNKPELHLRGDRSEMHYGAIALNTHGPQHRPETVTGEYWTDRKTSGRMESSARAAEIFTRFTDAERASRSEPPSPSTTTQKGDHHGQEELLQ